ncbi:MAG: ELWxxDGT repeat protein [Planctomycetia bacterium]
MSLPMTMKSESAYRLEALEDRSVPVLTPELIVNVNIIGEIAEARGVLYFQAGDAAGNELWRSDGTAAGTFRVADLNPGAAGSYPKNFADVGGTLFFNANDGSTGEELWKSDGTAAGTVRVADVSVGNLGSFPNYLTNVNGVLFFSATDGVTGFELWRSDGTAAGTTLVKDVHPDAVTAGARRLVNFNGTLYFRGTDTISGTDFWKSDGTAAGTMLAVDVNPGAGTAFNNYTAGNFVVVGDFLYFDATNGGGSGFELWKSDGTPAGTTMVADIRPGVYDSNPTFLTNVGGIVFFSAIGGDTGFELWRSDGTAAGTTLVKDIRPGVLINSYPARTTNAGGVLYFVANDGSTGRELWTSDGTAAGTALVADLRPGLADSDPRLVVRNGALFFTALAPSGRSLFRLVDIPAPPPPVAPPPVVAPANVAPVLRTTGKPPNIAAIATRGGLRVDALLRGRVADARAILRGIAMTLLRKTGGGVFEVSTDGGRTWRRVTGTVGDTRSLLLRAQDRLRLRPGSPAGRVTLQFRAWDQTTGRAGRFASTRANGGTTAFSQGRLRIARTIRSAPRAADLGLAASLIEKRLALLSPAAVDVALRDAAFDGERPSSTRGRPLHRGDG